MDIDENNNEPIQPLRRSKRIKNRYNSSHGSKLSGNKYYLFTDNFKCERNKKNKNKNNNKNNNKKQKMPLYPCISRCNRRLKMVHHEPNVFVIENFLTSNEINHLLNIVENNGNKFEVSYTQATGKDQIYSNERTSTFIFLQKYMDKISRAIEGRASDIVSMSIENVEPLQVVKYTKGQEFTLHHDAGTLINETLKKNSSSSLWSLSSDASKDYEQKFDYNNNNNNNNISSDEELTKEEYSEKYDKFSVQLVAPIRLFSFFVYLTTLPSDCGGETFFPKLGLKVRPETGKAILWSNVDPNNILKADPMLIHRAMPVIGNHLKVGMNVWINNTKVDHSYC